MEELRTVEARLSAAQSAYEAGQFDTTIAVLRRGGVPDDPVAIALLRDAYLGLGELTAALGEMSRLRRIADDHRLRRQARFTVGRLRETDPRWIPALPPAPAGAASRGEVVLHLLKESLPHSQTGYTFRSRGTLEAQRRAGYTPVVVTSLGFPWYQGREEHQVADGVLPVEHVHEVPHHRLEAPARWSLPVKRVPFDLVLAEQARRTAAIADEVRPAVIQAGSGFRGYDQALVGLANARRRDVPFVYEVRGFLEATWTSRTDLQERGEYYRRRRGQDERCMSEADLVVTIAGSMLDELVARGVDPDRIRVVPNVVDVERFTPRPRDEGLARELGVHDRFVVGYISNLGNREGVEHLLRATALLVAEGREVACLVAGDGPERPRLLQLVDELGLTGTAVLPGHVPNDRIESYYALIDAFVVPRIDDQAARLVTPLKPLEAMAMRRPVITSDLPALREMVPPGDRGLGFPPGDSAALAGAIAQLMDEPQLAEQLTGSAFEWVHRERTLEANVRRYREVMDVVLS
ncbi:glycosyltransferase [Nitriliruptoraceae bacterium ZYF776]|nr:glycosyltransferase [Profundirhabdus halotolerans]